MSKKGQRIRNDMIKIWVDNTGTTGKRDTQANDEQKKYMAPDFYLSNKYPPMKGDVDL